MDNKAVIKNILIPTDLNQEIPESVPYAISLSNWLEADLYILITYRLIDTQTAKSGQKKGIREYLQEEATRKITLIRNTYLEDCMVRCHFLVEIGFLHDRIKSNIAKRKIDLVVLDEEIEKILETALDTSAADVFSDFDCPVMYVPKNKIAV